MRQSLKFGRDAFENTPVIPLVPLLLVLWVAVIPAGVVALAMLASRRRERLAGLRWSQAEHEVRWTVSRGSIVPPPAFRRRGTCEPNASLTRER